MRRLFCMILICALIFVVSGCGRVEENGLISGEASIDSPASASPQAESVFSDASDSDGLPGSPESVSEEEDSAQIEANGHIEQEAGEMAKEGTPFNFQTKTVMLNSGYEMPIYGLGTYSLTGKTCVESVTAALDRGVRLIDTAYMYHNDVICCEV